MSESELMSRLALANEIARSAGRLTLDYFQTDRYEVVQKGDGSPLTIADQEAETMMRAAILDTFPDDGIVGEEFGITEGKSGFNWILDPIDGTKSFICGVPLYGTMVAVEKTPESIDASGSRNALIGSVFFPGIDVGIFASRGQGAWSFEHDSDPVRARVSSKRDLSESVLVTTSVETFGERRAMDVYHRVADPFYYSRTWGDVYGYYLVATGRVEVMIDPILNIWDAAAVQPIIEEAGGRFSDWNGKAGIDGSDAVGSNGWLHESIIELTQSSEKTA